DAAAIKRRYERATHGDENVSRQFVGIVLAIHRDLELPRDRLPAVEHVAQRLGAGCDRFRMAREQVEEALFPRQQSMKPAQHVVDGLVRPWFRSLLAEKRA